MPQCNSGAGPTTCSTYAWRPASIYLLVALLFMAASARLYWPLPELAFSSDNSPVSWLSSAQLWAMAVLSVRLSTERVLPAGLGLWLGIAMTTMAFDEQFMLHEQWKYGCIDWFTACQHKWVTELPMALVGIVGMTTAIWLHRTLPTRGTRLQLWLAIGVGIFALYLDLWGQTASLQEYEEAFEVIAEAIFIGIFIGLRNSQRNS